MKLKYLIVIALLLCGCEKAESNKVTVKQVIASIAQNASIDNAQIKDLTKQKNAEEVGVSPADISEGIIYYSTDEDRVDKVILVKAKSRDNVANVENALSAEIIEIADFWSANVEENKKVEKHLLKTKGNFVMLAISDDVEEIEAIYDNLV